MSEALYMDTMEQEQQDEQWEIVDDQAADWAIRQIASADAELGRMETWYKDQLQRVIDRHDQRVAFFTGKLASYMGKVPAKETKTTIKYALASGEMVLTKEKEDFSVSDDEALLGWCQTNAPELVKVELKPAWAEIKKRLQATDAGIVDTETGAIVEGVEQIVKPEKFAVKVK